MKLKKILAGALAAATAVACMPVTKSYAYYDSEWVYGDYACRETTTVSEGDDIDHLDIEIIKYLGDDKDVVIPEEINGHKVIGISGYSHSSWEYNGGAFANRTDITSIKIPESVKYMNSGAFENCTSLTSVTIPSSVEYISLDNQRLSRINVFSGCTSLTSINVDEKNENYSSVDGVLFSKDMKTLEFYPIGKTDETYNIPDGVETIHTSFETLYLKNLFMPASLKSIPTGQLYIFGDDVDNPEIMYHSSELQKSSSLISIEVDEKNEFYSSVDGVLYNKDKTQLLDYPRGKKTESLIVPNSVKLIGDISGYFNQSLVSITIPSNVKYMNICPLAQPSLKSITIFGTPSFYGPFYGCDNLCFEDCSEDLTIYCIADSKIEEYAKKHNVSFKALTNLTDEKTNISVTGNLEENITVKIEQKQSQNTYISYDITLFDGEKKEIQPSAPVEVSIPVPETFNADDCKIYRKESDGTYTDMNAVYRDGYMFFVTDHFSEYILSTQPLSNDENGENTETTSSSPATENPPATDSENNENTNSTQTQPATSDTKTDNTDNNGTKPDDNVNTGVLLCFVPVMLYNKT